MKKSSHPLRVVRCQHNLTIGKLAEEAKVGASTIWRAEHGYPISAESRRMLCSYFDMTSQELGLLDRVDTDASSDQEPGAERFFEQPHHAPHISEKVPIHLKVHAGGTTLSATMQEQQGIWFALEANHFASFFDADWTVDTILDSLRVVLQGVQNMPAGIRRLLMRSSMMSMVGSIAPFTGEDISDEERAQLTDALSKGIAQGWQLSQTSDPAQVLVAGQALLYQLQQTRVFLTPEVYSSFYAAIYNLIGSALFFQGCYDAAQKKHEGSYQSTQEIPEYTYENISTR